MVCGEDKVPEVWVLAMATGRPPPVSPLTHSLECTSPECTLGDGGARYKNKTPEYPLEFTMQMLQMHREDNHQQPRPAQVGESGSQNRKAEKVSHPTFQCLFESYKRSCQLTNVTDIRDQLLACCESVLRRDFHRYLGTGVDKTEVELLAEIKKIAVITRSNLVNVVSLMSAAQEHDETCRSYLARIRGLANVCKLDSDMCCSWL